jgi:hypothetical protein
MRKSMNPRFWPVISQMVQKVLIGKSEKWFARCGESLVEWSVSACAEDDADSAVKLILHCVTIHNARVLSLCSHTLTTKLLGCKAGLEAATVVAQGIINSLEVAGEDADYELMSRLAIDLAPALDVRELLNLSSALAVASERFVASARALLSLSIALLKKRRVTLDEVKDRVNSLFEAGDEGKRGVLEELLHLDEDQFRDVGSAIAKKAALVIATPNDDLRRALSAFFVRMSGSWTIPDT